jgi:hypothetical protein
MGLSEYALAAYYFHLKYHEHYENQQSAKIKVNLFLLKHLNVDGLDFRFRRLKSDVEN